MEGWVEGFRLPLLMLLLRLMSMLLALAVVVVVVVVFVLLLLLLLLLLMLLHPPLRVALLRRRGRGTQNCANATLHGTDRSSARAERGAKTPLRRGRIASRRDASTLPLC